MNKKSGMLGISGESSDFRDITAAAEAGDKRATLAKDMLVYDIKKDIGAYAAAMNGLDAVIFTGGIGENAPNCREARTWNIWASRSTRLPTISRAS